MENEEEKMKKLVQILKSQKEKDNLSSSSKFVEEERKVYYSSGKYLDVHPCAICGSSTISTRCIVVVSKDFSLWSCFNCAEEKYPNNYRALYGVIKNEY